uniref:NADH-ubiquinone oxidoreductase chain 4 n=1 Tax=Acanthocheilonema viteae TaxID=6277 RepID=G8CRB0_ACAVI|nr:NADH dehydrogenase subunit 4 [Acanthocheilonema viteae]ADN52138.1 NADH dehydrogenase subunit 4 [Acanthocheilonema viteae]BAV81392.1 NADH dehydrogenase subunit 4 [Acanthocheilonema viteae]
MFFSFFVVLLFFSCSYLFFVFFVIFVLFGFFDFSWCGSFFFFDSFNFVFLSFMSVFVLGFICVSEILSGLVFYSCVIVFFSVCFFYSGSIFMLYVFYELTMIPVLFCLLGYGRQVEKVSACYYLIFYTLFFGMPYLFLYSRVFWFLSFVYYDFFMSYEFVFLLSLCFLVKFPVYFVHIWLPKVHVESPTSTSMILAGIMLKLGGCGVYRMSKSLSFFSFEFLIFVSLVSMVFCSFICMVQSDCKSLAAYSSICHMGFVLLSELSMVYYGKSMALVMMLAHGYTSFLMFYFIGEFYHISNSRLVYYLRGYFNVSVLFCLMFCLVMMSNFGFPVSISFFSEYLMLNWFSSVCYVGIFFLFFYYLVSFYYSVYILVGFLLGNKVGYVFDGRSVVCLPLVFMMYNFFWFVFVI